MHHLGATLYCQYNIILVKKETGYLIKSTVLRVGFVGGGRAYA